MVNYTLHYFNGRGRAEISRIKEPNRHINIEIYMNNLSNLNINS
jgi:hypothetical protein